MRSDLYVDYNICAVKKLKSDDLTKVIKRYIINTNFLFNQSFYLFINIYYNIS